MRTYVFAQEIRRHFCQMDNMEHPIHDILTLEQPQIALSIVFT